MQYTTQELLIGDALMTCVYALAIGSLLYYHKKLEYGYLKLGAFALLFSLLSELLASLVLHLGLDWLLLLSIGANLLFTLFMYVILQRLAERQVSFSAIVVTVVASVVLSLLVVTTGFFAEIGWMIVEVPGAILLIMAIARLLQTRRTPGVVSLTTLLLLHVAGRAAIHSLSVDESLFATVLFFGGVVDLLSGCMLALICAERLMDSLGAQSDELMRFEQENRRLELQFSQAQKHESLGVMAGGIAHDFNNMLTSVLGYTSLALKKLPADSDVRKDLYMVMSGARQAADLTSQMLVYAGKGAIEFESVDLSQVVDNMAGLVNSIVPRKIHLVNKIGRDLPLIKADSVQLGQVVMNLIANSVDAIENREGIIEIQTGLSEVNSEVLNNSRFKDGHEPGAYIYLRVTDTGVGMDFDRIERIFDPFYSDKQEGKGLGLSSISGIVRQHKGFVHIDSAPDKGSVFSVYFPVISYRDVANFSGAAGSASPRLKGRVLLADDDPRIRGLIASILEGDGFAIVDAEDGREATQQVTDSGATFDLFVIDCTMPKMSGTDVYRQIRSSGLKAPVILISGYHQEQVINDISKDNDAYFIKKPFGVDELVETVNTAVTLRNPVSGNASPRNDNPRNDGLRDNNPRKY